MPNEGVRRHATEPGDGFIIRKLSRDAIRYRNANAGDWRPPVKEQATKSEETPEAKPVGEETDALQRSPSPVEPSARLEGRPQETQRQNASQGSQKKGLTEIPIEASRKRRLFELPNEKRDSTIAEGLSPEGRVSSIAESRDSSLAPDSGDVNTPPKRKLGEKTLHGRYRDETGHDLGEVGVKPTDEQAEAVKFFEDRGRKVVFFKSPDGLAAHSFHDPASGVTYLNSELTAESGLWYLVGHEFSHASGADQRLADLPAEKRIRVFTRNARGYGTALSTTER